MAWHGWCEIPSSGVLYLYACGDYNGTGGRGIAIYHASVAGHAAYFDGSVRDSGQTLATGYHSLVVSKQINGGTSSMWIDGALVATFASDGALAGSQFAVGSVGKNQSGNRSHSYTTLALSARYLTWTDDQAKRWHYEPESIFEGRRIWVPVSAGTGADLTIPDSAHAHTSDNLALTTDSSLVIADATHGHTSEQVTLNTAAQLAVADAAHTHTSDATSLTTASSLTVANAAHAHTSEQISLTASGTPTLEVSDSAHAHTAEAVSLSAQLLLAVQDAAHAHTADNVVIELAGAELLRAPSRLVIASPQRQVSFTLGRVRRRIGHTLIPTE